MAKEKDPAFLFYSTKFYEGTRTLLPDERACLVDLMIYQHQRGIIPDDPKRVAMYCTGISEATLQATLEAKFKRVDGGWVSETMCEVMGDRKEYAEKQAVNGRIGQFWKKAKAALNPTDYKKLRAAFFGLDLQETHLIISEIQPTKEGLKAWFKQRLSKALIDKDVDKGKDTVTVEDKDQGDRVVGEGGDLPDVVSEIITYLNELADRDFRPDNKEHAKFIIARLSDGYKPEELKAIIALKVHEWKGDPKMSKFLRPSTLFNSEKAATYRDEVSTVRRTGIAPEKNGKTTFEDRHEKLKRDSARIIAEKYKQPTS